MQIISGSRGGEVQLVHAPLMVPTWTGKMGNLFPVREKSGNFDEQTGKFTQNTGKVREFWPLRVPILSF